MRDDQHDADNQIGRLADRRTYRITTTDIAVMHGSTAVIRIPIKEIAAVSRGGRDVIITCKSTDPVSVTGATVEDARRLEVAIQRLIGQPTRRRWRW